MMIAAVVFKILHPAYVPLKPVKMREGVVQFKALDIPIADELKFLEGDFAIVKNVNSIPGTLLRVLAELDGSAFEMANPGERFNSSDVFIPNLPRRRLIFAALATDRYLLYYEKGGIALFHLVEAFRLRSGGRVEPAWSDSCNGPATTLEELRSQLAKNGHSRSRRDLAVRP